MYQVYEIKENDSLSSIAQKANTSIDEIRRLNGLSLNTMLMPGSLIVLPSMSSDLYEYYIVQKGDNLFQIANNNNIDLKKLLLINGLDEKDFIYPGQQILIPKRDVDIYFTENETIGDVARKLGIDVYELINQNPNIYLLPEQMIISKKSFNN